MSQGDRPSAFAPDGNWHWGKGSLFMNDLITSGKNGTRENQTLLP